MSHFRALAHLEEQLGDERFATLIDSANTGKVREFCDELINVAAPIEVTITGRTYEVLGFLQKNEASVTGYEMVERAKEMNAHLGADDGQHLLDHQNEIPVVFRGKTFVFTDWRHPVGPEGVAYVYWGRDRWVQSWRWLGGDGWYGFGRVLRRKTAAL